MVPLSNRFNLDKWTTIESRKVGYLFDISIPINEIKPEAPPTPEEIELVPTFYNTAITWLKEQFFTDFVKELGHKHLHLKPPLTT